MSYFNHIAKITDYLYLCSAAAVTPSQIREYGITLVINCTLDVPPLQMPNLETYQIKLDDTPKARLGAYFDKAADRINSERLSGGKALVHCIAGVSRSASICLAYLMKYQHVSLHYAYTYVKTKRPVIRPNFGFFRQLIEYENKIFGKCSVQMTESSIGWIPDVYLEETKGMVW